MTQPSDDQQWQDQQAEHLRRALRPAADQPWTPIPQYVPKEQQTHPLSNGYTPDHPGSLPEGSPLIQAMFDPEDPDAVIGTLADGSPLTQRMFDATRL